MADEAVAEFESSLGDLTQNSKPLISMLTMLAEENEQRAAQIVQVIEAHLEAAPPTHKLPTLYLIDSIIKNIPAPQPGGGAEGYRVLFARHLVRNFVSSFERVDERMRAAMYRLRQTWTDLLPPPLLHSLDCAVARLDPAWPITAEPPSLGGAGQGEGQRGAATPHTGGATIHVNPRFLKQQQDKEADAQQGREADKQQAKIERQQDKQPDRRRVRGADREVGVRGSEIRRPPASPELCSGDEGEGEGDGETALRERLEQERAAAAAERALLLQQLLLEQQQKQQELLLLQQQVLQNELAEAHARLEAQARQLQEVTGGGRGVGGVPGGTPPPRASVAPSTRDPRLASIPLANKSVTGGGSGTQQTAVVLPTCIQPSPTPPNPTSPVRSDHRPPDTAAQPLMGCEAQPLIDCEARSDFDPRHQLSVGSTWDKPLPTTPPQALAPPIQAETGGSEPNREGVPGWTRGDLPDLCTGSRPNSAPLRQEEGVTVDGLVCGGEAVGREESGQSGGRFTPPPKRLKGNDSLGSGGGAMGGRRGELACEWLALFGGKDQDYRQQGPAPLQACRSGSTGASSPPCLPDVLPSAAAMFEGGKPLQAQKSKEEKSQEQKSEEQRSREQRSREQRLQEQRLEEQRTEEQRLKEQMSELLRMRADLEAKQRELSAPPALPAPPLPPVQLRSLLPMPPADPPKCPQPPAEHRRRPQPAAVGPQPPSEDLRRSPEQWEAPPAPTYDDSRYYVPEYDVRWLLRTRALTGGGREGGRKGGCEGDREGYWVHIDGQQFEVTFDNRSRHILLPDCSVSLRLDPSTRQLYLDDLSCYCLGDDPRDVPIGGRRGRVHAQGPIKQLWIDKQLYEIRLDAPAERLYIGSREHKVRIDGGWGGEGRRGDAEDGRGWVVVDGFDVCPYGPPGIAQKVTLAFVVHTLEFSGPPHHAPPHRQILIDGALCDLDLGGVYPAVCVGGVRRGIRFDGPPREVLMDGVPLLIPVDGALKWPLAGGVEFMGGVVEPRLVALGGPGHELIVDGEWHEVKFGGGVKVVRVGARSLRVQLRGGAPEVRILGALVHAADLPWVLGGGNLPPHPPPANLRLSLPPTVPPQLCDPPLESPRLSQPPIGTSIYPGLSNQSPLTVSSNQTLAGDAQEPRVAPVTSQMGVSSGGVDVKALLHQLLTRGLIQTSEGADTPSQPSIAPLPCHTLTSSASAPPTPPPSCPVIPEASVALEGESGGRGGVQGVKSCEVAVPDLTTFDLAALKERHAQVVRALSAGVRCAACTRRICTRLSRGGEVESEGAYSVHLDWHYAERERERVLPPAERCRGWALDVIDWIQHDVTHPDLPEGGRGAPSPFLPLTEDLGPGLEEFPVAGEREAVCALCREAVEQFWDGEGEVWRLRGVVRLKGGSESPLTYHHICFKDAREGGGVGEGGSVEEVGEGGVSEEGRLGCMDSMSDCERLGGAEGCTQPAEGVLQGEGASPADTGLAQSTAVEQDAVLTSDAEAQTEAADMARPVTDTHVLASVTGSSALPEGASPPLGLLSDESSPPSETTLPPASPSSQSSSLAAAAADSSSC